MEKPTVDGLPGGLKGYILRLASQTPSYVIVIWLALDFLSMIRTQLMAISDAFIRVADSMDQIAHKIDLIPLENLTNYKPLADLFTVTKETE